MKKKRKSKPSGLRRYWPHLTGKQAEAERLLLALMQDDKCAICKRPESQFKKRLSVDHNHRTGKVRGLLCFYCNKYRVGRTSLQWSYEVWQYLLKHDPEGG